MNERGKKQWLIQRVIELSKYRKDEVSYQILSKSEKQDDLSDVIGQTEALFKLLELPTIINTPNFLSMIQTPPTNKRNKQTTGSVIEFVDPISLKDKTVESIDKFTSLEDFLRRPVKKEETKFELVFME